MRKTALLLSLIAAACGTAGDTIHVAGTIEIREVNVAPLVAGRLERLLKDEGDTVHAGDTIAVVRQPGLDDRIAEARSRRDAAIARVRDLEAGARPQELATARAALDAALADSMRATSEYHRIRNLRNDSITTPSQLENAEAQAEMSWAAVRRAREQLDLVAAGPRAHQLAAARREADAAAAAIAQLEAQRDELVLRAPADGIVLLRLAEAGEALGAGTPVVTVGLVTRPWVRAYVGQGHIARVTLGAPVALTIDGYPSDVFRGEVSEISPTAEFIPRAALTERERADLVYGIKVRVDDAQGRLKAGIPVDLVITLAPRP